MLLSMSILSWYLKDHKPISHIEDDDVCIKGLRFVMDDVEQMQPEYVYFGNAEYFFADPQYAGAYLAVNRHSILIFMHSDYTDLLNGLLSAFDFFNRWESSLLEAGAAHAPLSKFLALAEPVLCNPFLIVNLDGSFLISTDLTGHRTDPLWEEAASDLTASHPAIHAPYFHDEDGTIISDLSEKPTLVRNVYDGGLPVLMLYLRQNNVPTASIAIFQEYGELTLQNSHLVPILARFCIQAEEFVSASGAFQSGTTIFQGLLEEKTVGELNLHRLKNMLPPTPWRLLAFRMTGRTDQLAIRFFLSNLKKQAALYFPILLNDLCFCLIAEASFHPEIQELIANICVGTSMPFSDLTGLHLRKEQAEFALAQSDVPGGVHRCEDYAFDYLIRSFRTMKLTTSLLHPALDALDQYDKANQTELRLTLSIYLKNECNQLLSAQEMHIHPNTMRYRLQRIMEIAGLTLEDSAELNYLRLSDWLDHSPN